MTELQCGTCGELWVPSWGHKCRGANFRQVRLSEVIEALEHAYHPQNPRSMHPADFVTKHFKGEGHEGLTYS